MDPKSSQNPASWGPKSTKLGPKIVQNRCRRRSWTAVGAMLAQDGSRSQEEPQNPPKMYPKWSQLGGQNPPKIVSKAIKNVISFFNGFVNQFLQRLVAKLGPNWEPKPSQNGAKLDPKSKQVGAWFENLLFKACRLDFL